jgi:glycosyltransferase involved in cell wall biosynthesis
MGNICFVASSHEFLFRHFSPAIAAARAQNHNVFALLPADRSGRTWNTENIRIVLAPFLRQRNSPPSLLREVIWLTQAFAELRPTIVVAYSLRMCLITCLARLFFRSPHFVLVITGTGFIGLRHSLPSKLFRWTIVRSIRAMAGRRSRFIFENSSDAVAFGFDHQASRQVSILMGAGVCIDEFAMVDLLPAPPFRFCTVSRLIWSKGVDIAAQAVSSLARDGYPVELHIYGTPDLANPRPLDPHSLQGLPGVHYHGFTHEVADVWRESHAAIFASRGGEGLPRALLEAASCGRPCIVTAVPGCADFVRDGIEGYVVQAGVESALKTAILTLISYPEKLSLLGTRARQRVIETSTTAIIQDQYEQLFLSLTATAPRPQRL